MSIKSRRLKRSTAKKKEYLKTYEARINRGSRNAPTYAQWESATATERGLMAGGMSQKDIKKLKRKK